MNDDYFREPPMHTLRLQPQNRSKRFPVVAQLILLILILIGLFSLVVDSPQKLLSAMHRQAQPEPESLVATSGGQAGVAQGIYPIKEEIRIGAKAAFVWDVAGKQMLYEKAPDTVLPLASITKLMTTLVAYELISGDTKVTVPTTATTQQSASGLQSGEVFTAAHLSELALLASSNDAAYSLANAIGSRLGGGDQTTQFVEAMNVRAEELDLKSMRFSNTTGLDLTPSEAGAYGSARDVTRLMEYILMEYPDLIEITKNNTKRVYNESGDYHDAENTNELVGTIPNLLGSKTGYTDLAGGNLVVAFDAGFNRPVIVTVLGSTREGRFEDVQKLVKAVVRSTAE